MSLSLEIQSAQCIPPDRVTERHKKFQLKDGDILIAMTGATAGKVGRIRCQADLVLLLNQRVARIAPRSINTDFFWFTVSTERYRTIFFRLGGGAAQPNMSGPQIESVEIPFPPPVVQDRIAEILSKYDDLIENNRRRMALLEESARLLYQEWFVRLRFPGHEHTRIVNGLPAGWERKKLIELCESVDYGYTASADQEEIGPKFLRITDIVPEYIDWDVVPYCPIEDERLEKFRLHEGDIVIARTGATVGYAKRMHKRHPESVFASYLVRLRPRVDVESLIIGIFVESQEFKNYIKSRVGGAAQPNANAQVLSSAEIVMPTFFIQREFRDIVEPLIDEREVLQMQNQKLRAARDLLLPRLMSGEISV